MQYLIDTDWAINCLRQVEGTTRRLNELLPVGVGISLVSLGELYDGVYGNPDPDASERRLLEFLAPIELVDLDTEICRIFARERYRLRRAGNLIGDFDLLIGATALRHSLTLLTNNRRHFRRLAGLDLLSA